MAISALLAVVCDFEADAIGVSEKGCPIIRSVLGVELCFRRLDTSCTKLIGDGHHISD